MACEQIMLSLTILQTRSMVLQLLEQASMREPSQVIDCQVVGQLLAALQVEQIFVMKVYLLLIFRQYSMALELMEEQTEPSLLKEMQLPLGMQIQLQVEYVGVKVSANFKIRSRYSHIINKQQRAIKYPANSLYSISQSPRTEVLPWPSQENQRRIIEPFPRHVATTTILIVYVHMEKQGLSKGQYIICFMIARNMSKQHLYPILRVQISFSFCSTPVKISRRANIYRRICEPVLPSLSRYIWAQGTACVCGARFEVSIIFSEQQLLSRVEITRTNMFSWCQSRGCEAQGCMCDEWAGIVYVDSSHKDS